MCCALRPAHRPQMMVKPLRTLAWARNVSTSKRWRQSVGSIGARADLAGTPRGASDFPLIRLHVRTASDRRSDAFDPSRFQAETRPGR